MLNSRDIGGLQGAPVLGRDNEKLGTVGQVFLDSQTGAPNWVTVKTGLFGHKETFVPLTNAQWNGEEIHVDIDRDTLKEAPRVDTGEALSPHNEEALYRYYGLSDRDDDTAAVAARPDENRDRDSTIGPSGQTVTPIPTGVTDADRSRNLDRDGYRDTDYRDTDYRDTDASRRDDDTAAGAARPDGADAPRHADADRRNDADDRPRNLDELHPGGNQRYGTSDSRDLRMSEQPLGEPIPPASDGAISGQPTGRHSRMRRYDPADGVDANGQRIDQSEPPRTL
ncbi:PRC-barrel domain-containing protein [Mycetocola sp.]|uniref:PRC-barrel domain-containing protein n=1 Tax=Mycetocola sp. TaxID=1871042 RepID=UPI003988EFDD